MLWLRTLMLMLSLITPPHYATVDFATAAMSLRCHCFITHITLSPPRDAIVHIYFTPQLITILLLRHVIAAAIDAVIRAAEAATLTDTPLTFTSPRRQHYHATDEIRHDDDRGVV